MVKTSIQACTFVSMAKSGLVLVGILYLPEIRKLRKQKISRPKVRKTTRS
jgi:hypothetical protein